MAQLAWIALGGALGALARHGTGALCERLFDPAVPWGTFTVNAVGSFFLGLLVESIARNESMDPGLQAMLATGFLGAFTTFSTYSVQSVRLVERGDYGLAAANVLGNVIVGLGLAALGIATARRF
jgi:CrcB protein